MDHVGSVANAATVIAALHRGEKRLVFCESRRAVEELGDQLRLKGVNTFLSHASLSMPERHRAEQAFAEARDCVIVSTSTLELGIDVGDLDRIIQLDAPSTVASFLQCLGRTGRRSGTTRNCLFLALSEAGLLSAAALLLRWSRGWVEPVVPRRNPATWWHNSSSRCAFRNAVSGRTCPTHGGAVSAPSVAGRRHLSYGIWSSRATWNGTVTCCSSVPRPNAATVTGTS